MENSGELWYTIKRETLKAADECIGERPRSGSEVVLRETLENRENCVGRQAGDSDRYRALSRGTRTLLRRDEERNIT